MTKKHFRALASALADARKHGDLDRLAKEIASICKESNPAFDFARFMDATYQSK